MALSNVMTNGIDIQKRTLGISFLTNHLTHICLWAPSVDTVSVAVCDKDTPVELSKNEYGYWTGTTDVLQPGDLYQFILNDRLRRPDPASLAQPDGPHGPSMAVNLSDFGWTDQSWNNLDLHEYIFYELHTGTFSPEGTFAGIEQRLDHLKALGITAIEIMPVAQFPGARNWGYDGVLPFAVQHEYGGARALQQLVDACHRKGLAVVLDVVYNHIGPEGNYFNDFGPYFTNKHCTPWGDAINFDDAGSDGVRRYVIENVLMWFRDFHIDALRLDAVHAIKDLSPVHILRDIREHVDQLMQQTGRRHYLIVESDLNDPLLIDQPAVNGYGMDAQWIDEFHHSLRVTAGGERKGYYGDFEGLTHLAKSYQDAYVYEGQYSSHRGKTFGRRAEKNPGHQFIVFSQNHDQVGNQMLGERSAQLFGFEMAKLLAGSVLVSPFLPLLFMGEEWAEPNPFLYFVSHTDQELAEKVREGRKREFADFHSDDSFPDPIAEETFNQSKLQWKLLAEEPHRTMFRYYQHLIRLRKEQPALRSTNRWQLHIEVNETANTIQLHRWHSGQHVRCLMNFSMETQTISLPGPAALWQKLFDSAAPDWMGPAAAPDTLTAPAEVALQPQSLLIYQNHV